MGSGRQRRTQHPDGSASSLARGEKTANDPLEKNQNSGSSQAEKR